MTDAEIIPLRPGQPEPHLPRRPGKEVEPAVFEGELVDDDAPVLVDQPQPAAPGPPAAAATTGPTTSTTGPGRTVAAARAADTAGPAATSSPATAGP